MTSTPCLTCDQPVPERAVFCSNCGDTIGPPVVATDLPPEDLADGPPGDVDAGPTVKQKKRRAKTLNKRQTEDPVEGASPDPVVGVDEPPTSPPLAPDVSDRFDGATLDSPPSAPPPPQETDRVAASDDAVGPAPRRTLWIRIGLAMAIIVALVVGASLIFRGRGSVGADSPEEAVEIFFQAIDEGDYVRLGQIVAPGEAGSAADLVVLLNQRLGEYSLPPVNDSEDGMGISIKLDRAETVEEIDGRAVVDVDGDITFSNLPVPDVVDIFVGDELTISFDTLGAAMSRGSQSGLQVIAVEVDGRWYVSPVRTLAVLALELVGIPIVE